MHLLKWRLQPDRRSSRWIGTINIQRREIAALLDDMPSLRRDLAEKLNKI